MAHKSGVSTISMEILTFTWQKHFASDIKKKRTQDPAIFSNPPIIVKKRKLKVLNIENNVLLKNSNEMFVECLANLNKSSNNGETGTKSWHNFPYIFFTIPLFFSFLCSF